jgi:hypothetical protein
VDHEKFLSGKFYIHLKREMCERKRKLMVNTQTWVELLLLAGPGPGRQLPAVLAPSHSLLPPESG